MDKAHKEDYLKHLENLNQQDTPEYQRALNMKTHEMSVKSIKKNKPIVLHE